MSCSKSTTLCFRSAGCRRFQRNLARRYNSYVPGSTRTFRESDLFLSGVSSARSSCAMLRAISSWTDNTSRSELNADVQTREASEARQEKQGTTQGAVSAILAQLPNPPSFYCSGSSVFSFICRITSFNCLRNAVSLKYFSPDSEHINEAVSGKTCGTCECPAYRCGWLWILCDCESQQQYSDSNWNHLTFGRRYGSRGNLLGVAAAFADAKRDSRLSNFSGHSGLA